MLSDDERFAAFAAAVCDIIVANIIEVRAVAMVLEKRGLISTAEIQSAIDQAPPSFVEALRSDANTKVMKAMKEYIRPSGSAPIQ
jgi:hypothetical protein